MMIAVSNISHRTIDWFKKTPNIGKSMRIETQFQAIEQQQKKERQTKPLLCRLDNILKTVLWSNPRNIDIRNNFKKSPYDFERRHWGT